MKESMRIQMQVLMTPAPVTGREDMTVRDALKLMKAKKIHHLPIARPREDGSLELVGIVTERDLLHATSILIGTKAEDRRDRATLDIHLKGLMTKKVHTLSPIAPLKDGIRLMLSKSIGCIPIIEFGSRLVGIVTVTDLLKILDDFVE